MEMEQSIIELINSVTRLVDVKTIISFALIGADSTENAKIRNQFVDYFGHFGTREILNNHTVQSFINVVPTAFYVENDTIKNVIESQLPSPVLFMNRQKSINKNKNK